MTGAFDAGDQPIIEAIHISLEGRTVRRTWHGFAPASAAEPVSRQREADVMLNGMPWSYAMIEGWRIIGAVMADMAGAAYDGFDDGTDHRTLGCPTG